MDYVNRIREYREAKGWTRPQLAIRAGVHKNTIENAENSEGNVRVDTLLKISKALGVSIADIFFEDNVRSSHRKEQNEYKQ